MKRRHVLQICRWLRDRLPELKFHTVNDPRARSGRRWKLQTLLQACTVGLMAGCQNLWQLEWLTDDMSLGARRLLRVSRRIPDTTLRDVLCRLDPDELRTCLHRLIKAAWRRKALATDEFPFHIVALDGKSVTLPCWDTQYCQRVIHDVTHQAFGLLRTVTCALVSARGRPCIDAIPIDARTNEMGMFKHAFDELIRVYAKLFRVVSYDAGGASEANARHVVEHGKDYIMRIKGNQGVMKSFAKQIFADKEHVSETQDWRDNATCIIRRLFIVPLRKHDRKNAVVWKHTRSLIKVEVYRQENHSTVEKIEERYYATSMWPKEMTGQQWLKAIRAHWGVENNNHCTLDKEFREDTKPWIKESPRGALAVLILRRIAYSLLTLRRSVTLRSEDNRLMRWADHMRQLYNALLVANIAPLQQESATL